MNPQPKTIPKRNPALLKLAHGQRCLLNAVYGCAGDRGDTTVACHSNFGIHGKAKGRKADDCYTVWGCAICHSWLDQGNATKAEKEQVFMAAHLRQVLEWRKMAHPAARWALEQINERP
jgi:hypothetical protein